MVCKFDGPNQFGVVEDYKTLNQGRQFQWVDFLPAQPLDFLFGGYPDPNVSGGKFDLRLALYGPNRSDAASESSQSLTMTWTAIPMDTVG